jgi:hypothetical protein
MARAKVAGPLVAAGAILLLATGCGGGGSSTTTAASPATSVGTTTAATTTSSALSKSAYSAEMRALSRSLNGTASALTTVTTAKAAATLLEKIQTQLRTAADKLANIDPPASVKPQHEQLVKGIRDFADELDGVIAKLKGGSYQALQSIATLKGLGEIQAATSQIANKGFKIAG